MIRLVIVWGGSVITSIAAWIQSFDVCPPPICSCVTTFWMFGNHPVFTAICSIYFWFSAKKTPNNAPKGTIGPFNDCHEKGNKIQQGFVVTFMTVMTYD